MKFEIFLEFCCWSPLLPGSVNSCSALFPFDQSKTARQKKLTRSTKKGRHLLRLKVKRQHQGLKQKRPVRMGRLLQRVRVMERRPVQKKHQLVIQARVMKRRNQLKRLGMKRNLQKGGKERRQLR